MDKVTPSDSDNALFEQKLEVLNIGLEGFAVELGELGTAVTQLDWRPPAGGDPELADLLSKLGS